MLRKHLQQHLVVIPFTNNRYFVDLNGFVYFRDNVNTHMQLLRSVNGLLTVEFTEGILTVPQSHLVQLAFKPVFHQDFWFYLEKANVGYVDGSSQNLTPSNLIWKFTNSHVENGLYRIPGYSQFLIDKNGRVYNRVKRYYPNLNFSERDYVTVYAAPDWKIINKSSNAFIHRLMGLAFLPYGDDVCSLDINHINGNKHDFDLSNLEWCTRKENNIHAQKNNLKNDSDTVIVFDHSSGQERKFYSQGDCAVSLGLDKSLVSWRLKQPADRVYDGRYSFRTESTKERPKHLTSPKQVILVNLVTEEVLEFASLAKSAEFLNIKIAALKKRFSRQSVLFGDWYLIAYSPLMGETRPIINISEIRDKLSPPL